MDKKKYRLKIGVLAVVMNIVYLIHCFLLVEKNKVFLVLKDLEVHSLEMEQQWRSLSLQWNRVESLYYVGGFIFLFILITAFKEKNTNVFGMYATIVIMYASCAIVAIPLLVKANHLLTALFPITISVINIVICTTAYLLFCLLTKRMGKLIKS